MSKEIFEKELVNDLFRVLRFKDILDVLGSLESGKIKRKQDLEKEFDINLSSTTRRECMSFLSRNGYIEIRMGFQNRVSYQVTMRGKDLLGVVRRAEILQEILPCRHPDQRTLEEVVP